jgi:Uma2 family endonuclease
MKIMATEVLVSVDEYLRMGYRPDCDYLDGEVVSRNLGEFEHNRTQREILFFLAAHYPQLRERLLLGQRVLVRANRYRIPDICIVAAEAVGQKIVTTPPDLCIEILSPEDTLTRTMERVRDYFAMGVSSCWIIDPVSREGWVATPGQLSELLDGILRAQGIEMPLASVLQAIA